MNSDPNQAAATAATARGQDTNGEPDGRLRDLDARLRRVEAIIETAKRIISNNSGIIECALIELNAATAGPTAP